MQFLFFFHIQLFYSLHRGRSGRLVPCGKSSLKMEKSMKIGSRGWPASDDSQGSYPLMSVCPRIKVFSINQILSDSFAPFSFPFRDFPDPWQTLLDATPGIGPPAKNLAPAACWAQSWLRTTRKNDKYTFSIFSRTDITKYSTTNMDQHQLQRVPSSKFA